MSEPWVPVPTGDEYPVIARTCVCGHDDDEHDDDGICRILRCDCERFRDAENPAYGPGNPDWEHDRTKEDF